MKKLLLTQLLKDRSIGGNLKEMSNKFVGLL